METTKIIAAITAAGRKKEAVPMGSIHAYRLGAFRVNLDLYMIEFG